MEKTETKAAKTEMICPICRLLADVCECFEGKSEFLTHLNNARIEVLEGIKSLLESRIEALHKRGKGARKATKIEVS
jgi:hypothetical protein